MSMKSLFDVDAATMNDRNIAELRDAGALAALPVGAIEQHGPHLPVDTDMTCGRAVALAAARRMHDQPCLVFPSFAYGFSPHHLSRPGTISMPLDIFLMQVRAAVDCLLHSGFARVAVINSHGGNVAPLRSVISEMVTEGCPVTTVSYWDPSRTAWEKLLTGGLKAVGHACEFETALQLATRDKALAARIAERARDLPPRLVQPYVADGPEDNFAAAGAVAPPIFLSGDCGYYGDPAAATAELGHALVEVTADALAAFLQWFAAAPLVTGRD